ncbi:hypothetical protein [Dysgonomonas capnocytophagoides]|mgnify:CR=1 FL=1|uniref:hypothetical protein n=1 Tax=Dysgonomonas capnocytophagoides TaxID=45254 RepID=UPI002924BBC2|nr:hypothetical protein DCPSUM001_12060 [Dysgonomonas capnocytophagoides]
MKIDKINSEFIEAIKSRLEIGTVMETLLSILPLSKEAVYRRLRGEVLFSYSEAVMIAQNLQISLDEIGLGSTDYALYSTNIPTFAISEGSYTEILNHWIGHIARFQNKESAHFYVTTSGLPVSLLTSYPTLLKFSYYISLYEKGNIDDEYGRFSETMISRDFLNTMSNITALLQNINSTYILSNNPFGYYLKQIRYLHELDLLDEENIEQIKQELYSVSNDFKTIAASGKYKTGYTVDYYLSEVNIDASFGLLDDGIYNIAFIKMLGMNYRLSRNIEVLKTHRRSFDNLKHFATLISKSGSSRRKLFFEKQKAIIDKIGL